MSFLQVSGLKVEFRRDRITLDYPDFTVETGGQVALTGPSGSGKSTLLHAIAGLLVPAQGSIKVGDVEVNRLGERQRDRFRAQSIGYLFQDFYLTPDYTARENVILGLGLAGVPASERNARAQEVLAAVDIDASARRHIRRMSTGERQRVALARAVAHKPKLLLADEPTAHLDRSRAASALQLLRDTAESLGISLLVVTHDPLVIDALPRGIELRR